LTTAGREWPSVTFTDPVPDLRYPLKATFEIEGDRPVSGLSFADPRIWLPTGAAMDAVRVLKRYVTTVRGDVSIDPTMLSYQCEFATAPMGEELPGVVLTPALLSALLKRLGAADVMIHSVNQSTDTISAADGQRVLGWDIWGRHYMDIYPVDVHLHLTSYGAIGSNRAPSIAFTLTGRVLVNSQFEAFGDHVQQLTQDLSALVSEELAQGRRAL